MSKNTGGPAFPFSCDHANKVEIATILGWTNNDGSRVHGTAYHWCPDCGAMGSRRTDGRPRDQIEWELPKRSNNPSTDSTGK